MRELAVEIEHLHGGQDWVVGIPDLGVRTSGFAQQSICAGAASLAARTPDRLDPDAVCAIASPVAEGITLKIYSADDLDLPGFTRQESIAELFRTLPDGSSLFPIRPPRGRASHSMGSRSLSEAIHLYINVEHLDNREHGEPDMLLVDLPVRSLEAWIRSESIIWMPDDPAGMPLWLIIRRFIDQQIDPAHGGSPRTLLKDLPIPSLVEWVQAQGITWVTARGHVNA